MIQIKIKMFTKKRIRGPQNYSQVHLPLRHRVFFCCADIALILSYGKVIMFKGYEYRL